jgi:flagellar hook-associated protein 2
LSPGLTVNLLAQSTSPVTVTVSSNFSSLQSALSGFVSDYNSAVGALQQNVGQSGGALAGDSLIYTLSSALDQIAQFTSGSGAVSNLAGLGVTLDDTGQLSFNQATFAAASPADIGQFLGSISSSTGFLQTANNSLTSIADPVNGLIASDGKAIQGQITSTNSQIADDQSRISQLQTNLQSQLAQADAAIATLQGQVTYFQQLFTAEYGNSGSNSSGG